MSVMVVLLIINVVTYVRDLFDFGNVVTYVTICKPEEVFHFTVGKGWGCNLGYDEMMDCFENWKEETNQPECKLGRIFPMEVTHAHRWLHYIFSPKWHHPYIEYEEKEPKPRRSRKHWEPPFSDTLYWDTVVIRDFFHYHRQLDLKAAKNNI